MEIRILGDFTADRAGDLNTDRENRRTRKMQDIYHNTGKTEKREENNMTERNHEEKQFYAAIDLGTTNSVFAYGNMLRNRMHPVVAELDRKSDTGTMTRSRLLPSVVFYYKDRDGKMLAEVGDYAKSRYGINAGYVCKSVKSLMGISEQAYLAAEVPDQTPAEVSARILSYMKKAAGRYLPGQELQDIVITIPASFDSEQCQATLDAAKLTGIDVDNWHETLLYEPKAAIYDFLRMEEEGEIASDVLNLEQEKNVMVFDLGGGTLDVTLHRVGYAENGMIQMKDLAISRYTQIGGDNFDELLAMDMLQRFEEMYGMKVSLTRRKEVLCKLRRCAEKLKTDFSLDYETRRQNGTDMEETYTEEAMDINLYDSYAFEATYTKAEMEQVIAPLLGKKYSINDVSKIQKMDEKDVNNIIYPILDVLEKAGPDTKIDAVILNGGMTKFYPVRERLKEFFGFEPLETSDPDLAVARGAVYYHYCMHKYQISKKNFPEQGGIGQKSGRQITFCAGTILNDTINLGLRGEYVSRLIPAGTELPFCSEEIRDKYRLEKATDTLGIQMFLGRGMTKNLPNRRIATRTVKFQRVWNAGTPISFRIYMDSLRRMTMEAWVTGRPETRTTMEMDMASLREETRKTDNILGTTEKLWLNAKAEMNQIRDLAAQNRKRLNREIDNKIKQNIAAILQAENPEDFFEPCMKIAGACLLGDMMLAHIYQIATGFADVWNEEQKRQLLRLAKRHFAPMAGGMKQSIYIMRKAAELIAALDPDFANFYAEYLTRVPEEKKDLRQEMIQHVIRKEPDDEKTTQFLNKFLQISELNKWIALALAGRYGRESSRKNQKLLAKLVKNLTGGMKVQDFKQIPPYLPVLIAELCGSEKDNPLCTDKYTVKPAWQAIKNYLTVCGNPTLAGAVTEIWNGEMLSEEEEAAAAQTFLQERWAA